MNRVVTGKEFYESVKEGIDLLCNTVSITLGPFGKNIIVDDGLLSPFITNDGVSIAKYINSDNPIINNILFLIKEASIKTNDVVGDGTTTTLVLLKALYERGLKYLKEIGINELRTKILNELELIIKELNILARYPKEDDYLKVATIASGDHEMGKFLSTIYLKYHNKNAISISESKKNKTYYLETKGYIIESILASYYFLGSNNDIKLDEVSILLIDNNLNDLNDLSLIINYIVDNNKSLVIIANDYHEDIINYILNLNYERNLNIILLKTPEYGKRKIEILKDLAILCRTKIVRFNTNINPSFLGEAKSIIINNEEVVINNTNTKFLNTYVNNLTKLLDKVTDEFELDFINKRINNFKNGHCHIYVGGTTSLEIKEKVMRYIDTLSSLDTINNKVLVGGGISLLQVREKLLRNNNDLLFSPVLLAPFKEILTNMGLDFKDVFNTIKTSKFKKVYNVSKGTYEDIDNTLVVDTLDVVTTELRNATSICLLLLSTGGMVISDNKV